MDRMIRMDETYVPLSITINGYNSANGAHHADAQGAFLRITYACFIARVDWKAIDLFSQTRRAIAPRWTSESRSTIRSARFEFRRVCHSRCRALLQFCSGYTFAIAGPRRAGQISKIRETASLARLHGGLSKENIDHCRNGFVEYSRFLLSRRGYSVSTR